MNSENPSPAAIERTQAEPITNAALLQSTLILSVLGVVAYKVLDAALRLL